MEVAKFLAYFMYGSFIFDVSYQMLMLSSVVVLLSWWYLKQNPTKQREMTEEQEEELLSKWQPEELVPELVRDPLLPKKRVITSKAGKYIDVDGVRCLNMATHNYLGLVEDMDIINKASMSINKYGVGSCGPRGFYGTVDVHLELEEKLAEFMNVEEACVYSYGFSTTASAIPAYCKRADIVFVDCAVNFAIQKGLDASRSQAKYFKHNDMVDLKRLLNEQEVIDKKNPKKAARTRKFLIVEGIYLNNGNICNLPELVNLRKEYKLRMLIDETISFGTLGNHGRGVIEYFNIPVEEVDLRIGSMEGSLASIGGFCCGTSFIVEHQRLSGIGYCFSASLPPLLAVTALTSLQHIENKPQLIQNLNKICSKLHEALSTIDYFTISGDPISPVKHLYIKDEIEENIEKQKLNDIVDYCFDNNVAVLRPPYLEHVEKFKPKESIRIIGNVLLTDSDIETVVRVLADASKNCK